jgi:hypothetical protein
MGEVTFTFLDREDWVDWQATFAADGGHWVTIHVHAVYMKGDAVSHEEVAKAAQTHGLNEAETKALHQAHAEGKIKTDAHLYQALTHKVIEEHGLDGHTADTAKALALQHHLYADDMESILNDAKTIAGGKPITNKHLFAAVEPAPEIVIVGSSSSFTMQPADVTALTGKRTFNASVHGGIPRDYLGFLRYMEHLGRMPGQVKGLTWLLFGVYFLQADVVIFLRAQAPVVSALHPVFALFDFALAVALARAAWPLARGAAEVPAAQPALDTSTEK